MEMSQENQSDTEKGDTKSPPRHKRKRSSPRRSAECVTINLYGELAELWDDERGTLSDTQFVEQLLCLRERYEWLKSRCKCGVSLEAESGDSGGENVCPESDDEVMNLPDSNPEPTQLVKGSRQIVKIEVEDTDFVKFYDSDDDEFFLEDEIRKGGRKRKGHGPELYTRVCEICHGVVAMETPKRVHILSEHFAVFVNCKICQNSQGSKNMKCFVPLDEFYDHLKSEHIARNNKCPFCRPRSSNQSKQLLYTDSNSLRLHILKRHPQNLMCRCKECCVGAEETQIMGHSLIKAVSVKSHIAMKHSTRSQKKIPCPQCSQLITPASLQKHIKNMHEEKIQDKNNLCDVCGKYFVHLKQHKLSVHKGKESWSFKCKTCGKPFAKRYNLEVHSRIHTGEKPFVCDLCGKAFCQKVELRSHMKNNHSTPKKKQRVRTKKKPSAAGASSTKQDAGTLETTRLKSESKEIPAEAQHELSATLRESTVVQNSSDSIQPDINPQTSTQQILYAVIPEYTGTDNAILTSLVPNLTYISIDDKNQTQEILNWVNQAVSESAPPANE